MALTVLNGPNIAPGESLSDVLDCNTGQLVRITMPANWDSALITFEISTDGLGFNQLCDSSGKEIAANVIPGAALVVDERFGRALGFLRIRSGTKQKPVPQSSIRTFAVAMRDIGT